MKSTIRVELGTENKPVIRMRVYPTDDVRDVLFQQFKEGFQYESNLCYAVIDQPFVTTEGWNTMITIEPLPPRSQYICLQRVEEIFKCMQQIHPYIYMTVGGGHIGFYCDGGPGVELNRDALANMNIMDLFKEITGTIESLVPKETSSQQSNEDGGLPSRYQIDAAVATEDIFDGQVVGIRFTIGKVYYDILDKLSGKVIRDVDSCDVLPDPIKVPIAK